MSRTAPTTETTKRDVPMSFGSFEGAMVVMLPRCAGCNCRIVATGVRSGAGAIYCSNQCACQSRARS
ncbi:MAG: hypothetical protein ABI457_01895 [Hyphomicrobium sp.]